MMAQKNRKDVSTTETYLPKIMFDFELLWTCILKIRNQFGMTTYTKEIVILKFNYSYYKGRGIFTMFILVSTTFRIATERHSGFPRGTFRYLQMFDHI